MAASFAPTLSLADIDLGTVTVNVPGQEWFVNVVNAGPGSFLPAEVVSQPNVLKAYFGDDYVETGA